MVEKLAEVKSRMEASEAAHKVVHPGTELPVATMELVLEEFASKYSFSLPWAATRCGLNGSS